MKLLMKIKSYGLRRAVVRSLIVFLCNVRASFYRTFLSDNSPVIVHSKILQATQFVGKGKIQIFNSRLGAWPSPGLLSNSGYIEARGSSASVEICPFTCINNSYVIIADRGRIRIGKKCLIGPNFFATDSDFHGIEVRDRLNGKYECGDVVIEDDVFIGEGVTILKGVTVGRGAVIGSGSLVVDDVDEMSVYAGVPAKKLRLLNGYNKSI